MRHLLSTGCVFVGLVVLCGCASPATRPEGESLLKRRIAEANAQWKTARTLAERRDACIAAIDRRLIANHGDFEIVRAVFGEECHVLQENADGSGYARVDLTPKDQRPPPGWVFGEWYFHVDFAPNGPKRYVAGYYVSNHSAKDVWTPPSDDK